MKTTVRFLAVCFCSFFACQALAIDTYFPGDGPPTSADVETTPPQYYVPQTPQPDLDDSQYNNPGAPINPNEMTPSPADPLTD